MNSDFEKMCNEEQERRWKNSVQTPKTFLDSLWNEKGSNLEAMVGACNDIIFWLETASPEEEEEDEAFGAYSNITMELLRAEKADIATRITYVTELADEFQVEVEKVKTMKAGNKEEEEAGEDEDEVFQDAAQMQEEEEEENELSSISKTQDAAADSQTGAAKIAAPHPQSEEGGQEVAALSGHGDG